ncbi:MULTISPECIES: DASH family cryptochrome [Deefgea]|uniref:Cryptochrome DASH n=1 Tax=Deefgea chitinilytica TaxID=570276 RepID=A0ABS2CC59_9NEIS|nr:MULTISPECIES: DASH family cryptochrome [Deefgea]MBM5571739.1 DASH family cryptochrome [Deefgea chitinilytica]MBM9888974.1 DASH family cryptochrome [Deefgea sp. CFH1-16]
MSSALYWFRNDLRLSDNAALNLACQQATELALVYCLAPDEDTKWGFTRIGKHRKAFLADTLQDLSQECKRLGNQLLIIVGQPSKVLPQLMRQLNTTTLYCESIAAPEEIAQVEALRAQGVTVTTKWQSTLFDPSQLPFAIAQLPATFTPFRQQIEKSGIRAPAPQPSIERLPAPPAAIDSVATVDIQTWAGFALQDARSAFPYHHAQWRGGATTAAAHLQHYIESGLADSYKQTRNGLIGTDYSTKFSPWLASGALSARQINHAIKAHEASEGANESTYWIGFELLWRDYFRFLHLRYGRQLYRANGLNAAATLAHHTENFYRWCQAQTGEPFIDAGMRELTATGYLSNRMRQNVASFLVHQLQCDWRAGAAWFETQLIDYDVYSNQGNWLYLAGCGTDPRANRRFSIEKQIANYDPEHTYLNLWRHSDSPSPAS